MSALLAIEDLTIDFFRDGRLSARAVRGVSLEVAAGEALGVVGETGCGKTVTGLSVLRMLPRTARTSGRIVFDGHDVLTLPERELRALRGSRVGMVFQNPGTSFNPVFPIGRQLQLVAERHLGLDRRTSAKLVAERLREVELPDPERTMRLYAHEMSGGMLQRAMIAMAILCRPSLLIADEPTTALDVTLAEQILRLLRSLQREYGFAVFFISHDLDLVGDFCDRVSVLYAGRVVESGPAAELLAEPHHPYTRALLEALPRRAQPGRELTAVSGSVPTALEELPGCAFAPRCPLAGPECSFAPPPFEPTGLRRSAACYRWELA
ncbi:MAG: ABC transporter ATP-binding protein [Gaiellaceae bacterium]